ncbi:MAG: cytochrome c peroxidase [Bradymonadia bacterium]|jgi:cytochrome c peroxidase
MGHQWPAVVANLSAVPAYVADFQRIYNGPISEDNVTDAIAEFERTLRTPGPFDA